MKGSKRRPSPLEYWGPRKRKGDPPPIPKVLILEGIYGPEEIAALLLLAVGGNRQRARKILLELPKDTEPRANEIGMYLAAYAHQQQRRSQGKRCTDHTALKRRWPLDHRSLWNKLKATDQTLKKITASFRQATKLVKPYPKNS